MRGFEYKVVPAPVRGLKGKGIKGTQARFANALQTVMNDLGAQGWEYQRTDTLPVEERQGLTGKTTSFQNMLVFRRALAEEVEEAPVVAALIEDQTDDVATQAEEVDALPEAPPEEEEPIAAATLEGAQDPVDDTEPEDPLGHEARERVGETLTAKPFTFPWNRRREASETPAAANDAR